MSYCVLRSNAATKLNNDLSNQSQTTRTLIKEIYLNCLHSVALNLIHKFEASLSEVEKRI